MDWPKSYLQSYVVVLRIVQGHNLQLFTKTWEFDNLLEAAVLYNIHVAGHMAYLLCHGNGFNSTALSQTLA